MMDYSSFSAKLVLAYPPISNYDFTLHKKEETIKKLLDKSMLYIVAQRAELTFENINTYQNDGTLRFDIKRKGNNTLLKCKIAIYQKNITEDGTEHVKVKSQFYKSGDSADLPVTEKVNSILLCDQNDKPLLQFNPDKFLYLFNRKMLEAEVEGTIQSFTEFKVLYVGKATEQKIWDRLTGHQNLQNILSLEAPLNSGSLPSHEIMLLLFKVTDKLGLTVAPDSESISKFLEMLVSGNVPTEKTLSLDSEKALIKLLNPQYNTEKFAGYPKSKDGMFKFVFNDFSYQIIENLVLLYNGGSITGSVVPSEADIIFIKDNSELILKQGGIE